MCVFVRGASWLQSLTLVLRECQGCRCDFLPQPELHLLGHGVSSHRASLLAPRAALGLEHTDLRSPWKVKTRAALKVLQLGWSSIRGDHLLRPAWEKGENLRAFYSEDNGYIYSCYACTQTHANYNLLLS